MAVGTRCADHVTPLYPQKLALTSPTGGGRSVGIVRSRTKATEFSFFLVHVNNQLDALFLMCLFHFSTCFKQPAAHHQENQLYQLYISLCVDGRLVCTSERSDLHTRWPPTRSDIYQMMYWYKWFFWWWALGCLKHVEKWNKHIKKVRQVGY